MEINESDSIHGMTETTPTPTSTQPLKMQKGEDDEPYLDNDLDFKHSPREWILDDEYAKPPVGDWKLRAIVSNYVNEVINSRGFDVTVSPPHPYGWMEPCDLSVLSELNRVEKSAKFAVDMYNTKKKKQLEFVEVVKANYYQHAGFMYYITLKAKNKFTRVTKTYQTRVLYPYSLLFPESGRKPPSKVDNGIQMDFFRVQPE